MIGRIDWQECKGRERGPAAACAKSCGVGSVVRERGGERRRIDKAYDGKQSRRTRVMKCRRYNENLTTQPAATLHAGGGREGQHIYCDNSTLVLMKAPGLCRHVFVAKNTTKKKTTRTRERHALSPSLASYLGVRLHLGHPARHFCLRQIGVGAEGVAASKKHPHHHTEGPHVHLFVDGLAGQHLGRATISDR